MRISSKKSFSMLLVVILFFCISCATIEQDKSPTSFNVALYSYIPDLERFEKAVAANWAKIHPNVTLNFVKWDCYKADPPENLDVFVFDTILLSNFIEKGYLLPITNIDNRADILKFVLDGCTVDGKIYAIPQIICTNLLYTRKADSEMANITTITDLYKIIGDSTSTEIIPQPNKDLLIDMSDETTNVCTYLDSLIDVIQAYTNYRNLPDVNNLNEYPVNTLVELQSMAGVAQVGYWPENNDAYIRAKWFQEGKGRAYMGYAEAMSGMGDFINDINFKTISLAKTSNIPLFFGDIVGINSAITDENKKILANELANVIASTSTMINAISPDEKNKYPQYLLPARISVYKNLESAYPVYSKLLKIAANDKNELFLTGSNYREWMETAKPKIMARLKRN